MATGNQGKLREYRELLDGAGFELVPFATEVPETGTTYEENAALKAGAALLESGFPSIGDDSGLEVSALDGFPGLHSARLAPTQVERTAELLRRLEGVPRPWSARFVCVIALARPDAEPAYYRGEAVGEIVPEWRGEAGFGYDPVFFVPGAGKTFGQMPSSEKHRWSHRANAVRALLQSGELAAT